MSQDIKNQSYRRSLISMVLTVFAVFTVYSVVMTTLYVKAETDVAFMIPVFVDIIPYATDLCELVGMLIAYTAVLYYWHGSTASQKCGYVIAFAALTVYKYIAKLVVTYIMNGALPSVKSYLADMLLAVVLPLLLELVQFAVILLIIRSIMKKTDAFIAEKKSLEGKLPDYHFDEEAVFFPFQGLFGKHNPLQRSALGIGIVITVSKAIQLLINDIMIGPPEDVIDMLWMLLYYLMCVVLGFASYLGVLWGLMTLRGRELKRKYK